MALLLLATLCSHFTSAQSTGITNATTTSLSFTSGNNTTPPTIVDVSLKSCVKVPIQATAFASLNNQAVFAIYQDDACKAYLYSVQGRLADMQGAKSMSLYQIDSSNAQAQGITFVDSSVTSHNKIQPVDRVVLTAIVSSATVAFLLIGAISLWCLERKKSNKRNIVIPQIEVNNGSVLPIYHDKNQEATAEAAISSSVSATSSVSYLPVYNSNNSNHATNA
ncbi:hypothetical protein BGX23_007538 [Mortierella sp. AD031]|nr:hypothetical protein BGX23_007538 [Mortierella sp. AD031]